LRNGSIEFRAPKARLLLRLSKGNLARQGNRVRCDSFEADFLRYLRMSQIIRNRRSLLSSFQNLSNRLSFLGRALFNLPTPLRVSGIRPMLATCGYSAAFSAFDHSWGNGLPILWKRMIFDQTFARKSLRSPCAGLREEGRALIHEKMVATGGQ
jgi:hypothetical protein